MRVAVLDLGSNSFTLLVADLEGAEGERERGRFDAVLRERESVQLAARLSRSQIQAEDGAAVIDQDGWRCAMVAMAGLVGRARMAGAERILAVATGVLRDADNGPALVAAASRELDIETAILTPDRAARLAYLGVRSELPELFGRLVVIDVGGGSIEISVGESELSLFDCSLPLGSQRLRAMLARESRESVFGAVRAALAPAGRAVRGFSPQRVVLASGTARAVHRLVKKRRSVGVGSSWMDRAALHRVASWAQSASPEALREAGVRADRIPTIAVSAALVDLIAQTFDTPELWVSRRGLREGVVMSELGDGGAASSHAATRAAAEPEVSPFTP